MNDIDMQFTRTIQIIKQFHEGKQFKIKDGYTVGMATDFTIGFVLTDEKGDQSISRLSEFNFRQLNNLLNKENVDFIFKD